MQVPICASADVQDTVSTLLLTELLNLLANRPKPKRVVFVLPNARRVKYKSFASLFPETTHQLVFFLNTTNGVKESLHDRLKSAVDDVPMWLHRFFELAPRDVMLLLLRLIIPFAIAPDPGQPVVFRKAWFSTNSFHLPTCSSLLRTCRDFAVSLLATSPAEFLNRS